MISVVRPSFLITALASVALVLPGCAFFSGKPPLPKHASIERLAKPAADTEFAALVENADIIYFPRDRAASVARSEPAALLLGALVKSGKAFAVGWDSIDATQQPLLDELASLTGSAREELIDKLTLSGSGRTREHCRAALRENHSPPVQHLALHAPAVLLAKLGLAEAFTPEDIKLVPRGFIPPTGGYEAYVEREGANRGQTNIPSTGAYRMELLRQQFAAEKIARHMRGSSPESKLLVFADAADLSTGQGIPYYVAQKSPLRQLVLGSDEPRGGRLHLLTRR